MMKSVLAVLFALVAGWAQAAAQNRLYVADFTQAAGKEASVPIYLDNSSDIVGLQFNITLPYAKSSSNVTLVDERSEGHSITLRKLSNLEYTVVIMSLQNRPLRGNGGLLVRFPVTVPADAQADDQLGVKLTNIVLTDRTGHNVTTATEQEATFTVLRTPTPDFVPTDLRIYNPADTLVPGGKLQLQFTVLNQGTGDSRDGWSEKIYLEDLTGQRTFVVAQRYGNTLAAGEQLARLYEVDIPRELHLDGTVHAVVELVALGRNDELVADQGNNSTTSANTKEMERRLFLSSDRIVLKEGARQRVTLTRSGDWTMSETFTLAETNDHGVMMLSLPATVTIPAKKAGVNFYVTAPDNSEVNAEYRTGLTVTGDDYPDVTMVVDVEDNDSYPLTLTTDKKIYAEGDALTLTATIGKTLDSDLRVTITNNDAGRFYPYIRSITIPAGQLSAQATTAVVVDNLPMADANVTFTATATGYQTSKSTIAIQDDDWPQLTLTPQRTIISEGDGYGATMVTLTRKGNTAENLTVYLNYQAKSIPADANKRELYFDSQYVIIPAGQQSVEFQVGVEDNSTITTQRVWTITAAACDAQTGKPVGSGHQSYATTDLTVTDDDVEGALKLQCGTATLTEGGGKATVTVSRNSMLGDLVIRLSGEGGNLDLPQTVTIANGQQKATFQVGAKATAEQESNYYARVTAQADGCQPAQFVFMVSTLPDAVCSLEPLENAAPFGGQTVNVRLNVTNQGTSTLQPGMEVRFYLLNKKTFSYNDERLKSSHISSITLTQPIAAGVTLPVDVPIEMPSDLAQAQYYLMAWANPMQTFAESNKANGMSGTVAVNIQPAFTLSTISTDKHNYTRGDVIHFTGQMSNTVSGLPMEGRRVDVYLLSDTKRYQTTATLDAQGRFTADYTFGEQTGGRYKVGACVHGTGGTETGATINVTRLKIERSSYLLTNITEGEPLEGDIQVTNLSEEPLYHVTFEMTGLPDDWTVELTAIDKLEGGTTGNCHYRVVATEPDFSRYDRYGNSNHQTINGTFVVHAQDSEGEAIADSEMPVYFKWYHANCLLVADDLRTTLYRDGSRTLTLTVENMGLKETGSIAVEYSSGQQWLTVPTAQLASIAKDGRSTLTLNLTGQADMIVDGTYEATIRLTPQNGQKKDVSVKCTVVSTDIATLLVDVVDAYTLGADDGDGPHVGGASVRLTNALTKEVVMTGTTGADGIFRTDILKEGTYYVYVTAPNHYYAEKTITVDPGVENQLEVFLNYEAVKISYTVERTTVQDEYKTELIMDIVPDIPQAIVVPTLPTNWGTGQHAYSVRLTNKGRLTAYTPFLEFPEVEGVTFKVLSDYPAVLYPNESFDVSVEFNGPETARETSLGYIRMYYAYKMRGDTHWSSETYLALMGDGDLVMLPGGGLASASYDTEGSNFGRYEEGRIFLDGGGAMTGDGDDLGSVEPSFEIRDYTKSIDNRVRLKFDQTFALEREAFRGTLQVDNQQMSDIENLVLVPSVKTLDGEDATDLFAISTSKGEGWTDSSSGWNLAATATGMAYALYVPAKEAAPTEPVSYYFGGTVTYRNVSDGKLVVYELTPTQLTVNPSPDLHLTYFVQRDFISDDPLTDEVEPWEPTQFALLIQNKGAGEALNLSIETSDPIIVDNACNLPVTFTTLYCTVDGQQSNHSFNNINLGSIAAGQSVMARWWFYCNVMAHVANYEARMTQHSVFGREFDLITLDGVRELTRSVGGTLDGSSPSARRKAKGELTEGERETGIMLLNLIADEENLPDHVMDQEGNETDDLQIVSEQMATAATAAAAVYTLTVTAQHEGWVYGITHDPTNCTMQLVKAVRQSDQADVTANLWQTDRTITSNYKAIVDNRLHLADRIGTTETYTLYYEPKPAAAPVVKSIELVVPEGKDESYATQATVTLAEPTDMSTMTADAIVLTIGEKTYSATVTPTSPTTFTVDWSANGLYEGLLTMTVFTSTLKNLEGTSGTSNTSKTWLAAVDCIKGDVNGDGEVNEVDAQLLLDLSVGNISRDNLAIPAAVNVPNGNSSALEVNAQRVLDYSVAKIKPW